MPCDVVKRIKDNPAQPYYGRVFLYPFKCFTKKFYKSKMPGVCPAPPGWWKQMIGALGTRFKFKIYHL
jgi:hypothetical protein